MENLEKIKLLKNNSQQIKSLYESKIPTWENDSSRYDKTGSGFNTDSRFQAHKPFTIWFESHMGTYGDSSCSSQCDLDDKLFEKFFLKFLNQNQKFIMICVAELMDKEAKEFKEKALKELKIAQESIENI